MGAVLRLERFDPAEAPAPAELHTAEELQDAYAQGVIAGREQAFAEQIDRMRLALEGVSAEMAGLRAALADTGGDRARALAPLVDALLDGVLPAVARARLESALLEAFVRLAETVTPLTLDVRCGPDLAAFVRACAGAVGIEGVRIADDGPDGTVTAELLGGVMAWDQAAVSAQLRALVQEIMETQ